MIGRTLNNDWNHIILIYNEFCTVMTKFRNVTFVNSRSIAERVIPAEHCLEETKCKKEDLAIMPFEEII